MLGHKINFCETARKALIQKYHVSVAFSKEAEDLFILHFSRTYKCNKDILTCSLNEIWLFKYYYTSNLILNPSIQNLREQFQRGKKCIQTDIVSRMAGSVKAKCAILSFSETSGFLCLIYLLEMCIVVLFSGLTQTVQ